MRATQHADEDVLPLYLMCRASTAVLAGPSESPPKWSMYVMVSPALMAPTLVTASAMMAELGPVPLGLRQAVECAEYTTFFRFVSHLWLQDATESLVGVSFIVVRALDSARGPRTSVFLKGPPPTPPDNPRAIDCNNGGPPIFDTQI